MRSLAFVAALLALGLTPAVAQDRQTPQTRSAVERLAERAAAVDARANALVEDGRTLDVRALIWTLPDGAMQPLTLEERGVLFRQQFLGGGVVTINIVGLDVPAAANEALAEAYLSADDAIGPALIIPGRRTAAAVFADEHRPTPDEEAVVDRFLEAVAAYEAQLPGR